MDENPSVCYIKLLKTYSPGEAKQTEVMVIDKPVFLAC